MGTTLDIVSGTLIGLVYIPLVRHPGLHYPRDLVEGVHNLFRLHWSKRSKDIPDQRDAILKEPSVVRSRLFAESHKNQPPVMFCFSPHCDALCD
jgi:hypothetical protein